jgi:hypothetical protein
MLGIGDVHSTVPAPAGDAKKRKGGKQPRALTDGPPPPKVPKTAVDPHKAFADQARLRCMDYVAILRDLRTKLGNASWTEGLREMMTAELKYFETTHDEFAALAHAYDD